MKDHAIFLDEQDLLFSIVTDPDATAAKQHLGIVILNSGMIHNVGPFGLSVDLAKSLSKAGFPVMRLDQTGKGESADMRRESDDNQTLKRDLSLAYAALHRRYQINKIAIIGLCSGADHGIEVASTYERAAALVMLDGWAPRDFQYFVARYAPKLRSPLGLAGILMKRLMRKRRNSRSDDAVLQNVMEASARQWDTDAMWGYIRALCARKVPILAFYTGDADEYYSYQGQLGRGLSRRSMDGSQVTEVLLRDRKHLYPLTNHRQRLVKDVTEWICTIA